MLCVTHLALAPQLVVINGKDTEGVAVSTLIRIIYSIGSYAYLILEVDTGGNVVSDRVIPPRWLTELKGVTRSKFILDFFIAYLFLFAWWKVYHWFNRKIQNNHRFLDVHPGSFRLKNFMPSATTSLWAPWTFCKFDLLFYFLFHGLAVSSFFLKR